MKTLRAVLTVLVLAASLQCRGAIRVQPVTTNLEIVREALKKTLDEKRSLLLVYFPAAVQREICEGPIRLILDDKGMRVGIGEWEILNDQNGIKAVFREYYGNRTLSHTKVIEIMLRMNDGTIEVSAFKTYSTS